MKMPSGVDAYMHPLSFVVDDYEDDYECHLFYKVRDRLLMRIMASTDEALATRMQEQAGHSTASASHPTANDPPLVTLAVDSPSGSYSD